MRADRRRPTRPSRFWAGPALALGALVAVLLASEGALRAFFPQPIGRLTLMGLYTWDPELGHRLTPGYERPHVTAEYSVRVRINPGGFRDQEGRAERPAPGVRRIAVLGDSFAFGFGVEEDQAFPRVLERALARSARDRWEVLNFGVPGYGTYQELLVLRRSALAFQPEIVILAFYIDLFNNLLRTRTYVVECHSLRFDEAAYRAALEASDPGPVPGPVPCERSVSWFLRTYSHSFTLLRRAWAARTPAGPRTIRGELVADKEVAYRRPGGPVADRAWAQTAEALTEITQTLRRRGIRLLVVNIPSTVEIHSELLPRNLRREAYDFRQPAARLNELGARLGVPVLDLTPALAAASTAGPLYYLDDTHWRPQGHRVAGQAVANYLVDHGWVGPAR